MNVNNIKFRAWLKKEKKLVDVKSIHFGTKKVMYGYSNGPQNYGTRSCKFEDCILLQFYPEKDGVGNEIFEGDILYKHADLEHLSPNGWFEDVYIVVSMGNEVKMYVNRSNNKDAVYTGTMKEIDTPSYMVIGNIFENRNILTDLGFEVQEIC